MKLYNIYLEENNGKDSITYEQTVNAELKMILYELKHDYYFIYKSWKENYQDNPVYNAGYLICYNYEKPHNKDTKCKERGNETVNIYQIMVKDINKIDEIIGFSMTEQVNCEDIDPTNIDDCELSDEDKKIYDRCCYLNDELLGKAC